MPARPPTPAEPLRLPRALREFLREEAAGGGALLVAAALALAWANSPWRASYENFWATRLTVAFGRFGLDLDLRHWVNQGAMAVFFLVVGLEIKRELAAGALREWRQAALPVVAAAGGLVVPALIYAAVNAGRPGAAGWGIPMATDIAFALGVLALLGPRVPAGLKVFLLALAVVDDVGSIVVVAVFYAGEGRPGALLAAAVRGGRPGPVAGAGRRRRERGPGRRGDGAARPGRPPAAPRLGRRRRGRAGHRPRTGPAAGGDVAGQGHGLARRAAAARPAPAERVPGGTRVRPGQRRRPPGRGGADRRGPHPRPRPGARRARGPPASAR